MRSNSQFWNLSFGLMILVMVACSGSGKHQNSNSQNIESPQTVLAGDINSDLIRAVNKGDVPSVKTLLAKSADVNAKNERGETSLTIVFDEYSIYMQGILKALEDEPLTTEQAERIKGLRQTEYMRLLPMMKILLDNDADVNSKNNKGVTALMIAAAYGPDELVRMLLSKRADVNAKDDVGNTALTLATRRRNASIVQLLRQAGANQESSASGRSNLDSLAIKELSEELVKAVENGDTSAVQSLLAEGADVNTQDNDLGLTVLMTAAGRGHIAIVNVLLDKGTLINAKHSSLGVTPLMLAATNGRTAVVRILISKGADIDAIDVQGRTALMNAAIMGHPAVVQVLLASGADVGVKDTDGKTALMKAEEHGHADVVKLLKSRRDKNK